MSLAAKLIAIFLLLSIVPLSLVGYLAFVNGRQTIKQDITDRLVNTTLLKEAEFTSWLDDDRGDIETLAARPTFRQSTAVLISQPSTSPEYQAARRYILQSQLSPLLGFQTSYLDFSIIRASDGLILASTLDELEGKYREDETFFTEGQKATYIGNVDFEVTLGEQVMHISTPVKDESGAVIAVLVAHLNLADISAIMTRRTGLRKTEETYLVNTFNFMVTESRFEPDSSLRRAVYTDGVDDCLAHHDGVGFYDNYRGVPVIGAYKWIPERDLCIVTEIDQSEALAPTANLRNSIFFVALVIGLGVILVGVFFARTITTPVRRLVEGAGEIGQGHLDYRVGTAEKDEIGQLSRAFDQMVDALKTTTVSRDELEQRVVERTAQLEAANKELEAFSYSVSHDLRAPLRAMDGFSRILIEEYAPELSGQAQRYLGMVRDNAQQMGHLIDHLLAFSRLGRQALKKERVEPAPLVQEALDDLCAERGERNITVTVGDLPPCQADPALLRQVFANLLGNAFKFTKGRDPALIEVGCENRAGEPVYYVKDNGIGFDMQYADKLFGVFQRLHRAEDYEGSGVGLATVQRIIVRHGGRIWAEAEVGQGATFYFTLGGEDADHDDNMSHP